jgi:acylphosphatase
LYLFTYCLLIIIMTQHFNIRVSGKVQGVFFRASAKAKADALSVRGFVRNERDGSVYIEAEAEVEVLGEFVAWCHQGPPASSVERCDVTEGAISGYASFDIRR